MNEGFRSTKTLALILMIGLALAGVGDVLSVLLGIGQIASPDLYLDTEDGEQLPIWLMFQGIVSLLGLPVYLATIVLFLIWMYRSHSNLAHLKAEFTEYTPGWAVGWWFVPFFNLVRPFQVMREIWSESDPKELNIENEPTFLSTSLHQAPTFMVVWWVFWIGSNFSANIVGRVFDDMETGAGSFAGMVFMVNGILALVAAVLAIMVVRDVTARQEARHLALERIAPVVPPPPPTFGGY